MDTQTQPHPAATDTTRRLDLYAGIHKALRLFMMRTVARVGSADPHDAAEVADTLQQVERLLVACEQHLLKENTYVHPALERARPGITARIATEHEHHVEAFADLRDLAALVAHSADANRAAAFGRLYRALALFVADNFQHMQVEETAHNAVLWAAYTDAELHEIEGAIVGSIPPDTLFALLHWFIPGLSAPERAGMLAAMQRGMPPEVFGGVLGIAERTLSAADFAKLQRTLQQPAAPAVA
jgi:hypothetical protein